MQDPVQDLPEDELTPEQLADRTADLSRQVADVQQRRCIACGAGLCGHVALFNVVLGSRNAARCRICLGEEHGEVPAELAERTLQWIRRRQCFLHVWHDASEREQGAREDRPTCVFTRRAAAPARAAADADSRPTTAPRADHRHDAGDQGCGDLVLELRNVLADLAPGSVLHVTATDPAAPIDLPAWCGLTGHRLEYAVHPDYWIRRRNDR